MGFAPPLTVAASLTSLRALWSHHFARPNVLPQPQGRQLSFLALILASMGKKKSPKFYAIHKGLNGFRGVVDDWPTCQRKVSGVAGAVFKSFSTRAEAVLFSEVGRGQSHGGPSGPSVTLALSKLSHRPRAAATLAVSESVSTSEKIGFFIDRKPDSVEHHGFGAASVPTNPSPNAPLGSSSLDKRTVVVYTDGACSKNGQKGAVAGVGVFFGPDDDLNLSEKLQGKQQTNQRAEQTGVLRAMQLALSTGRVGPGDTLCIKTDSNVSEVKDVEVPRPHNIYVSVHFPSDCVRATDSREHAFRICVFFVSILT